MMKQHTLKKRERISSKKDIELLFSTAEAFIAYPLRILFFIKKEENECIPPSILISVGKRKFKKAKDRNRIKRLIREAYRLNKPEFLNQITLKNTHLLIAFIYIGHEPSSYQSIEASVKKTLNILKNKLI